MRRLVLIVVALAALVVAGCGDKEKVVTNAPEGSTVTLGGLDYQVQLSRFLNWNDAEDSVYLRGLPQGVAVDPGKGYVWFALWMRVKNYSDSTLKPVQDFTITDTQGNRFSPTQLDPKVNPFLYEPAPIPHAGVLPTPNAPVSSTGPLNGALIIFRLPVDTLQNRPLTLHIQGPANTQALVSLDL
jgi:hypothetical protein